MVSSRERKVGVGISLPFDLLEMVDWARGDMKRSEYVILAIKRFLDENPVQTELE